MSKEQQAPQAQQVHPAAVAQEFMRRADMKGGEVEAFGQTFNWLEDLKSGEIVCTSKEEYMSLVAELSELREFRRDQDESYAKSQAEASGEIPVLEA
jgi:hypothetical protein